MRRGRKKKPLELEKVKKVVSFSDAISNLIFTRKTMRPGMT